MTSYSMESTWNTLPTEFNVQQSYRPTSQGGRGNFTYFLEGKSILLLNCSLDAQ